MTKYLDASIIKAVETGDVKAVEKFLKKYANNPAKLNASRAPSKSKLWQSNSDGLLHIAIRANKLEVLALLLKCDKIDVNITNDLMNSPLKFAVMYRNVEAVKMLAAHKDININYPSPGFGDTALTIAVQMRSLEMVKILLERGANPNLKSTLGYDPASEAEMFDRKDIAELIRAKQTQTAAPRMA